MPPPAPSRSPGLLRVACLLVCVSVGASFPFSLLRGSRYGYSRNIKPLRCSIEAEEGTCMFAWNCVEAGGLHLGTCVDRFYFGSCCKLPKDHTIGASPNEITNEITDKDTPQTTQGEGEDAESGAGHSEESKEDETSTSHEEDGEAEGKPQIPGYVAVDQGQVMHDPIPSTTGLGPMEPSTTMTTGGTAGQEAAGGQGGAQMTTGEHADSDEHEAGGQGQGGQTDSTEDGVQGTAGGQTDSTEDGVQGAVGGQTDSTEDGVQGTAGGQTDSTEDGVQGTVGGQADSTEDGVQGVGGQTDSTEDGVQGTAGGQADSTEEGVQGTAGGQTDSTEDGVQGTVGGQTDSTEDDVQGTAGGQADSTEEGVQGAAGGQGDGVQGAAGGQGDGVQGAAGGQDDGVQGAAGGQDTTEEEESSTTRPLTSTSEGSIAEGDAPTQGSEEDLVQGTEVSVAVDPSPSSGTLDPTTPSADQDGGSTGGDAAAVTESNAGGAEEVTESGIVVVTEGTEGLGTGVTEGDKDSEGDAVEGGEGEESTTVIPEPQSPSGTDDDTTKDPAEVPSSQETDGDTAGGSTPANIASPTPVGAPATEEPKDDTTVTPLTQTTLFDKGSSEEDLDSLTTLRQPDGGHHTTILYSEPSRTTLSPQSNEVETTPSMVTQETTLPSVLPTTLIPVASSSEDMSSSSESTAATSTPETTTISTTSSEVTTKFAPIVFPGPTAATTEQPTERPPLLTTFRPLVIRPLTKPTPATLKPAPATSKPAVTTSKPPSSEEVTLKPDVVISTSQKPEDGSSEAGNAENTTEEIQEQMDQLLEVLQNATPKEICGKPVYPTRRIVGGDEAFFGEFPWQVSLRQWRHVTFLHKCGAALLNRNWAITAAHCVENVEPEQLLVRFGEFDLERADEPYPFMERKIQFVASHPQFDARTFEYDLALLRFVEPINFQPNIIPICIPEDNYSFLNETGFVTGWGRLYEDGPLPSVMQKVTAPVITNEQCESMYRLAGYQEHIPNIFICAGYAEGGRDSCEGDSGGPMVIKRNDRWDLAGIISWGIGCALPNQPGVYTRISEFRSWIEKIIVF